MDAITFSLIDKRSEYLSSIDERTLHLIIMPTERCNFRCTYCYESFEIGKMSRSVINSIKNLISKRVSSLDRLIISWFGGEPLLAKEIVTEIQEFAFFESNKFPQCSLSSTITTNGYFLNAEMAKNLTSMGLNRFQVTLDGTKDCHDKTRLLASGKGSFDQIWGNITSLLNSSYVFELLLRVHYTANTHSDVKSLVSMINDRFPNEKRLQILLKAIARLGGKNDHQILPILERNQKSLESDIVSKGDRISFITKSAIDNYVCYAAKRNSILIRADGRLGKCTVALEDPINTVGKIETTGIITIDEGKMDIWSSTFFKDSDAALNCPYSHIERLK